MNIHVSNKPTLRAFSKPVNIVRNLCRYTYNVAPRSYRTFCSGLDNGTRIAKEKNLGKLDTLARKSKEIIKALSKEINPIELPVVLSAIALPVTPVGGSVVAFGIGCILALPSLIKKLVIRELTFKDIGKFMHNMSKKDYVKPDPGIKETVAKLKSFTKLRK